MYGPRPPKPPEHRLSKLTAIDAEKEIDHCVPTLQTMGAIDKEVFLPTEGTRQAATGVGGLREGHLVTWNAVPDRG